MFHLFSIPWITCTAMKSLAWPTYQLFRAKSYSLRVKISILSRPFNSSSPAVFVRGRSMKIYLIGSFVGSLSLIESERFNGSCQRIIRRNSSRRCHWRLIFQQLCILPFTSPIRHGEVILRFELKFIIMVSEKKVESSLYDSKWSLSCLGDLVITPNNVCLHYKCYF